MSVTVRSAALQGKRLPRDVPLRKIRRRGADAAAGWLFILASLVGFFGFYALPLVRNLAISFTRWNMLSPAHPVGLGNYARVLRDPLFWNSLKVTAEYVLFNIPLQTVFALFLAVVMARMTRSIVVRGILILPYLIPPVVVGLVWLLMLNPTLGIIDIFLRLLGLPRQPFLGSAIQAMPSIAGINNWEYTGFNAILFYAGLQTVPESLYEAASLDGASEWRMFWMISLPLLRPVTAFVVITSIIGSFQVFDTIAVTTMGGPINATRVVVWYIYEQAFRQFSMGYGAAIATVLFIVLAAISLVQFRLFRAGSSELQ